MKKLNVLITSVLVGACGGAPEEETDLELGETESAVVPTEYEWVQGMGPVRMIPEREGFCYLTRLTGKFEGQAESILLSRGPDSYWYLSGSSQQIHVSARARCARWSELGTSYDEILSNSYGAPVIREFNGYSYKEGSFWVGNGSVEMSTYDRFCPLSGVQGALNGGGEYVTVQPGFGRWTLQTANQWGSVRDGNLILDFLFFGGFPIFEPYDGGPEYGTYGRAYCASLGLVSDAVHAGGNPSAIGEYSWKQGDGWTPMATVGEGACFLTGVSGKFNGGGEAVEIRDIGGRWHLGGQSQQHGVSARARCVAYQQPIAGKVVDGGFEAQTDRPLNTPWFGEGTSPKGFDIGWGYAYNGSNNAWIVANDGWNAITQVVPVLPYTRYTLSAMVRHYNIPDHIYFGVRDLGNRILAETRAGRPHYCYSGWTRFTCRTEYSPLSTTFDSGPNTSVRLFLGYWAPGSHSYLQADDFSLRR